MEVWWHGFIADPAQLLVMVVVTYLLLLAYNKYAGVHDEATWKHIAVDSMEEMGIGFTISFGMLLILNRISISSLTFVDISKIIVEAMIVSIGVSIGTAQLGAGSSGGSHKEERSRSTREGVAALALCGAVVVAGSVAPTMEIFLLAVEAQPTHVFFMALVSIALSVMIVFFSDFRGAAHRPPGSKTYNMVFDTCLSFLIGLGASAFMLWFFGRFEDVTFYVCFAQVITLGVLASVGASAGRLLIK